MKRTIAALSLAIVAAVALFVKAQESPLPPGGTSAATPAQTKPTEEAEFFSVPKAASPQTASERAQKRYRERSIVSIQKDGTLTFQHRANRKPRIVKLEELEDLLPGRAAFEVNPDEGAPSDHVQRVLQILHGEGALVVVRKGEEGSDPAAFDPFAADPFAAPAGTVPAINPPVGPKARSVPAGTPFLNPPAMTDPNALLPYPIPPPAMMPSSVPMTPENSALAGLRRNWELLEENTEQLARQLQEKLQGVTDPEEAAKIRAAAEPTIKEQVRFAFNARQELLRTELTSFEKRLEKLSTRYQDRDREQEAIMERRVAELMNPNARWDADQPLSVTVPGDRRVTMPAYTMPAYTMPPSAGATFAPSAVATPTRIRDERIPSYEEALFEQLDKNKDGVLQKAEWSTMSRDLNLKVSDKNNDDLISKAELMETLGVLHARMVDEDYRAEDDRLFNQLVEYALKGDGTQFENSVKDRLGLQVFQVAAQGPETYRVYLPEGGLQVDFVFENGRCVSINRSPGGISGALSVKMPRNDNLDAPALDTADELNVLETLIPIRPGITEEDFQKVIQEREWSVAVQEALGPDGLKTYTLSLNNMRVNVSFQNGRCIALQTLPAVQADAERAPLVPPGIPAVRPKPMFNDSPDNVPMGAPSPLPAEPSDQAPPEVPAEPTDPLAPPATDAKASEQPLPSDEAEISDADKAARQAADMKRWQGRWRVVRFEMKGQEVPPGRHQRPVGVVVDGNKMVLSISFSDPDREHERLEGELELDVSTSPRRFALHGRRIKKAIYEFRDDQLIIAMPNIQNADYPDSFDTSKNPDRLLFALEREPTVDAPPANVAVPADDSQAADLKRWQGRWRVKHAGTKGEAVEDNPLRELIALTVEGSEVRITRTGRSGQEESETARMELDVTTQPRRFMWRGGAFVPGIYEFREDQLIISIPDALKFSGPRYPDSFDTSQDSNRRLFTLEREPEQKATPPAPELPVPELPAPVETAPAADQ